MKTFEYTAPFYIKTNKQTFVEWLNNFGKQGWELVSAQEGKDMWYCIFKREILGI